MPTINELLKQKQEMERRMRVREMGEEVTEPGDAGTTEIEITEESLAELEKEQLQAIATEMGIEFDGRTGETKLRELILDAAGQALEE
ncbi:MAG: hypothetical protein ACLFSV_14000 [Alkalispirochaeta sp.]